MKRILNVITTLGLGGAETNLANLVSALDPKRFEVHVAFAEGGPIEERFRRQERVRLFRFAGRVHKVASFSTCRSVASLVSYIRRENIDIVHTHTVSAHLWGAAAARLTGRKLVEHVHDFRYMSDEEFRRRRGESRQFVRFRSLARGLGLRSDRILVLTQDNENYLKSNGWAPGERIRRIPNGIPLEARDERPQERQALRASLGLNPEDPMILSVSRIAPEKNIDLVFRIASEVRRRCPGALFVIAGDGPLYESFRCQAKGRDEIRMIGFVSDVRGYLAASTACLLPSFLELHSIALLEALAAGVPVVLSSGVGCHDEFIRSGENGLLVDPFSDAGWADVLVRLLEDRDLARRIGEQGRLTCERSFAVEHTAQAIGKVYDEL